MSAIKTLEVMNREVRTSKSEKTKGKEYAVVHVKTPNITMADDPRNPGRKIPVKLKAKDGRGNVGWEKSNLPSMKDEEEFVWGLQKGDIVAGDVVSRKIEPHQFTDTITGETRTITTATCTVFGDTSDVESFEVEIAKEFGRRGYTLATTQTEKARLINEEAKMIARLEPTVAETIQ